MIGVELSLVVALVVVVVPTAVVLIGHSFVAVVVHRLIRF